MQKKIKTERLVWIDVTITLLALTVMAAFGYGERALALCGGSVAVSLAAELISLRLMNKKFTADDLSCTSDALITALMMPAVMDYKIAGIACLFAVIAAKNVFGGRRNMIFSPAAAAYVFMLTSWSDELLMYPEIYSKTGVFEKSGDLVHSVSHTLNITGVMDMTDFEILMGSFSGPMGTGSILLLLVSAVILLFRRDISAGAFIGTMLGALLMAYLCPLAVNSADSVKYVLATNMILFAAIYIVSDLRIAPSKNYYAFFYGFFISITSYVVMLTTGKENVIVIVSVLFTPAALGFKNLQKKINTEAALEAEAAAEAETMAEAENAALSETEIAETVPECDNSHDEGDEQTVLSAEEVTVQTEASEETEETPADTEDETAYGLAEDTDSDEEKSIPEGADSDE